MTCKNCGNENATRWIYGAFGERCEGCAAAAVKVPKRSKMTRAMTRYIKSRYVGADGHVKCDPKFKPSEHYLGS